MRVISQTARTSVLLVNEESSEDTYVYKVFNTANPSQSQIDKFYNEWVVGKKLNILGIRKIINKTTYEGKPALKLEYIDGITLEEELLNRDFNIISFLKQAIQITSILGEIHQEKIIHKDICPQNIIVENETGQLKIIDFGLATSLNIKSNYLGNPALIQGNLNYISPEQTGRMNRTVDYRSDLYSLGITLYELLSGHLPFKKDDPLEQVHCHLAVEPNPPISHFSEKQKDNPVFQAINSIILKLLKKNAGDRYQSAFGLKSDLEICLKSIKSEEALIDFIPGQYDFSEKFQIPQRLYGREKELNFLVDIYHKASKGSAELVLVSGYSGVGKSSLVYEIHKPITENHGYFIEGKFDQFQRNIPYSAWIQAFENFIQIILTEDQNQLEKWKSKFLKSLNGKGKILTELIPSLEKIIGEQPDIPDLTPSENQNRFNQVFIEFVKIIAEKEHPLFIFIDDWQWLDPPSLELLEKLILEDDLEHLLITGAYRNNEVDQDHRLTKTIKYLKSQNIILHDIVLENLNSSDIDRLVADTLKCPVEYSKPLSRLVYQKTNGNAFFLRQMLHSLYEQDAISLKYDARIGMRWDWDIEEILKLKITDNVVELMVSKAKKLPVNTRRVLELASCIGTLFSHKLLAIIYQKDEQKTYSDLVIALEEGLIIPNGEKYTFSHDRIQQAFYTLIPEGEKEKFHFEIGKILLRYHHNKIEENKIERLFDLVNQLNYGQKFIVESEEKTQLAQLNYQAGLQAKRSIAYDSALQYLNTAKLLLQEDSWEKNYKLTFGIFRNLAEVEAISSNYEIANAILSESLTKVKSLEEKVEIAEFTLWVSMLDIINIDSMDTAYEVLSLCNIDFPNDEKILEKKLAENYHQIWSTLENKDLNCFIELNEMDNVKSILAFKILSKLVFVLNHQQGRGIQYEYTVTTGIILGLKYGKNLNLLPILSHFGSILATLERYSECYKIGLVATEISKDYPNFHAKAQYINRSGLWCRIYGQRLDQIIPFFEYGVLVGNETGNVIGSWVSKYDIALHHSYQGNPITNVISELNDLERKCIEMNFNHLTIYTILENYKLSFFYNGNPKYRIKDSFSEDINLAFAAPLVNTAWLGHVKLAQHFWLREYREVLDTYEKYLEYIKGCASNIIWADHFFYLAISIINLQHEFEDEEKSYYHDLLLGACRKIKKMAAAGPDNFLHKHLLIEAELSKTDSNHWKSAQLYNQAIFEAKKYEFPHIETLANELCGIYWHKFSQSDYAGTHFQKAYQGYVTWEAHFLAKGLRAHYPTYFGNLITKEKDSSYSSGSTYNLDLESLLKASQILSSEIVHSNLILKMIPLVLENAGAEQGYLISVSNHSFSPIAHGVAKGEVKLLDGTNSDNSISLPFDLLNYVARTQEPILLENAVTSEQFSHDLYIQTTRPKSVLCFPIFTKTELSHLFYLENNLAQGVFTYNHINILQSLALQIGISIENAELYEKQEKINKAYSKFVPHTFLKVLGHDSILDVKLGDQIQKNISVLFSDIRSYTTMSEKMSPKENFNFLNSYLNKVAPAIKENNGFVSQYLGDGIMALFLESPENAVKAAIGLQINVRDYNNQRVKKRRIPIKTGIGIHTGLLMLGILGEENHQQATVVSDVVNVASRIEGLTKYYNSSIIVTESVLSSMKNKDLFNIRFLGKVLVLGKTDSISIYEIYDSDPPELIELKQKSNPDFQKGMEFYFKKEFITAASHFKQALIYYPEAPVINNYFKKAARLMIENVPEDWNGADLMTAKF